MTEPMTSEELTKILEQHRLYLAGDPDGIQADFMEANLEGVNLEGACLRGTDLMFANLRGANLRGANLKGAILIGANLEGANLIKADLSFAILIEANLNCADLRAANLREADLEEADLREADLEEADLRGANLDYSVLPLWCGSLDAHFDDRQLKQIAYHLVKAGLQSKNASPETKAELRKILDFANGFHRVDECGIIVEEEGEKADELPESTKKV